ncbi:DUF4430 domain-containing protein [Adlercreutzia sp. ZJ138]|uniref:DUF4430 domain-containing protein n=1 Tax=Adlercreutzia sp. ZJ138 TaxID=2709405 RepID=UPI0013EA7481|nr:DUF4430 domain-containing protein [Adlercreutzia sp. ZJ138]
MSIGSVCVRSNEHSTHPCTVFRKAIALFMALVLAVSMTPSTAWAESTDEEFARSATDDVAATAATTALLTAQNASEAGSGSSNTPAADDESVSRDRVAASENSQDDSAQNGDDVASGFGDTQTTQDSEQASVDGSTPVATNDNDVSKDMTQLSVGATDEVAEGEAQSARVSSIVATCSVIGADAGGNEQVWAASESYALEQGSNAADLTKALFKQHKIDADYSMGQYGFYLETITSPFDAGVTLGYDASSGKYWQLFVNGVVSGVAADAVNLQPGDNVVWYYSSWGSTAPVDQMSITCEVVGQDDQGSPQTWAAPVRLTLPAGSMASDAFKALFEQVGLTANIGDGWFLNSITSPYTGKELGSKELSSGLWSYWQFFTNGSLASVGAASYELKPGDTVSFCYGSDGVLPNQVSASCKVIGLDASGNTQVWVPEKNYVMTEGATAADLSEQVFFTNGLNPTVEYSQWGFHLIGIKSPFDENVTLFEESVAPYRYWQLFVNGKPSGDGASGYELHQGDSIVWCYSTYGSELSDSDEIVVDPSASRPSFESAWPGFANGLAGGTVSNRPTPTESAELSWAYNYKGDEQYPSASDPLIVNGDVYLVVSGELRVIDTTTGAVKVANGKELRAKLGATNGYFCRPVYSEGIIIVPLDNGSLAAFTADTLTCVWKTSPLPTEGFSLNYQALSSLTVSNGCVYAGFTMLGADYSGTVGTRVCVRLSDGSKIWSKTVCADEGGAAGYYWAGGAVSGSDIVIGDENGDVSLIDGGKGDVKSTVSVGAKCRSSVIPVSGEEGAFLVVSYDGVLHKIVRSNDKLTVSGKVKFASYATSTPAVSNGKAFVCSKDAEGYGALFIIDLATMAVEKTVRAGEGLSQSAPLVSVQGDGTYVYFTCNALPGAVYGYKVGSDAAYKLYEPDVDKQNYCMSSVVADEKGNLYYTNDSGHLFALTAKPGVRVDFDSRGGSYVASCYVALGGKLVKPGDPTRTGYTFGGWFSDEKCEAPWDFSTSLNEGQKLYAKWVANASDDAPGGTPPSTPGDVGGDSNGGVGSLGGGHVPALRAPLTPDQAAALKDAEDDAGVEAADEAGKDVASEHARSGTAAKEKSADAAVGASVLNEGNETGVTRELNPVALATLLAGLAGLGGALVFLLGCRRKDDEEQK